MQDPDFSVIALRKGTVSGHSPRMRFDLIVNTMFKSALLDGKVTVNNASIWRPILDIRDAVRGYLRAVQADPSISGVFNVISDNYTVGAVGDMVKEGLEELTGKKIQIDIKNIQDFRNYKVTGRKAKTVLGYEPKYSVTDILKDLFDHRESYEAGPRQLTTISALQAAEPEINRGAALNTSQIDLSIIVVARGTRKSLWTSVSGPCAPLRTRSQKEIFLVDNAPRMEPRISWRRTTRKSSDPERYEPGIHPGQQTGLQTGPASISLC
jgi:hypothetical protein